MIAPAAPGDVELLVALDHLHRRHEIGSAIADGRCLIARLDGEPAGFATIGTFFGEAFVELLYVAADRRRQGIGRALLRHLAGAHAHRKLFTSTNRSNLPMQALLEGEGFIRSGMVENLDEGDPELIYCRLP